MTESTRSDPRHIVRIPVLWSAWVAIQAEAQQERRDAVDQAALILERHAASRIRKRNRRAEGEVA